jgi:hypothetical protein
LPSGCPARWRLRSRIEATPSPVRSGRPGRPLHNGASPRIADCVAAFESRNSAARRCGRPAEQLIRVGNGRRPFMRLVSNAGAHGRGPRNARRSKRPCRRCRCRRPRRCHRRSRRTSSNYSCRSSWPTSRDIRCRHQHWRRSRFDAGVDAREPCRGWWVAEPVSAAALPVGTILKRKVRKRNAVA